jgi:tRNA nucleotidyltransferase (CCA-adding enzyme)
MSDYMYMLESHLSPDQNRVVAEVQVAAGEANLNIFLTGGAMRDMLAGFRIRDLDFVVEGNALKVAKAVCDRTGAKSIHTDEARKCAELVFPSGATAQISMSRQEKYGKPGSKPSVSPATIQEDLRGRDFTCNAIALSLNRASRGLLLDPMNGLADIERRELRAISTYGFYDDPSRLLRLVRLSVRMGLLVEERTQLQVANAMEAETEKRIPARLLGEELRRISAEDRPSDVLKALQEAKLLDLFSPALGAKMNAPGLARFDKAIALLPDDARWRNARLGTFLHAITEKLSPKERQALIKAVEMPKPDIAEWQKIEARAKKLEAALKAPRVRKPSHVYQLVSAAAPEDVLFTLYHSAVKPVQERLRSYFEKYVQWVAEITPEEWESIPVKPGTPKYAKAREQFIAGKLDKRPKKVVEPTPTPAPPPAATEPVVVKRGR